MTEATEVLTTPMIAAAFGVNPVTAWRLGEAGKFGPRLPVRPGSTRTGYALEAAERHFRQPIAPAAVTRIVSARRSKREREIQAREDAAVRRRDMQWRRWLGMSNGQRLLDGPPRDLEIPPDAEWCFEPSTRREGGR